MTEHDNKLIQSFQGVIDDYGDTLNEAQSSVMYLYLKENYLSSPEAQKMIIKLLKRISNETLKEIIFDEGKKWRTPNKRDSY